MASKISPITTVRIYATIKSISGVLIDPTTLNFTITEPTGSSFTYVYGVDSEVARESLGVFYAEYTVTLTGVYRYSWQALGNVVAAFTGSLNSQR